MTMRRAVTYGGSICLLAAWLASAASTPRQTPAESPRESDPNASSPTETLAAEVQAHAAKLRSRLASARAPQMPLRNPFSFDAPVRPAVRTAPEPIATAAIEPAPIPEPMLTLIGIAADQGPNGEVRTALVADQSENVHIVKVGETLLGRYRVTAIGADAAELKDITTESVRRLALR
jgi:hypothetical protein